MRNLCQKFEWRVLSINLSAKLTIFQIYIFREKFIKGYETNRYFVPLQDESIYLLE